MEARHYSDLEWVEYLKGRASSQQSAMATHAEACESCRLWLTTCNELMHVVGADADSSRISQLVHETVANFTPMTDPSAGREVFAGLKFDTYLHTPVGVRSALISERRLSFESIEYDVEMTAEIVQRRLKRIIGHLLKKPGHTPAAGVVAEITIPGRTKYSGETDASGEFYFPLDEILTGDPLEIRFRVGDEVCLTALIPV